MSDEGENQPAEEVERTPEDGHLYHYTDPGGAKGIIESGRIWATDLAFLNDTAELNYGLSSMIQLAGDDPQFEDDFARFLSGVVSLIYSQPLNYPRPAGACFCEDGSLLSQWRGYGKGGGYSLGFDYRSLLSGINGSVPGERNYVSPIWVTYDPRMQGALASGLLLDAYTDWPAISGPFAQSQREDESTSELSALAIKFAKERLPSLIKACTTFKHPTFAEEREWRLLYQMPSGLSAEDVRRDGWLPIEFRAGPVALTPYVSLDLRTESGRLPLRRVVISPGPHEVERGIAMQMLLAKQGYPPGAVEIMASGVPFRPA